MASYTCEKCNYTTKVNWIYQKHLKSKKHIALQSEETSDGFKHICTYCSKRYVCTTGLKKHNVNCAARIKHEEDIVLANRIEREQAEIRIKLEKEKEREHVEMIARLERENNDLNHRLTKEKEHIEMINNVMEEVNKLRSQIALHLISDNSAPLPNTVANTNNSNSHNNIVDIANSAINSNNVTYRDIHNNTSIHQNVHVYLNNHCKDISDINEFIESVQFSKKELDEMIENREVEDVDKALIRLFKRKFKDIPIEIRPLHCVKSPTSTGPGDSSIFVMDDKQWKEENARKTARQIQDTAHHADEMKTPLNKATKKFTDKMYDTCKKLYPLGTKRKDAQSLMGMARECNTRGKLVESLDKMSEINFNPDVIEYLIENPYVPDDEDEDEGEAEVEECEERWYYSEEEKYVEVK
jgi:hypothetical protein